LVFRCYYSHDKIIHKNKTVVRFEQRYYQRFEAHFHKHGVFRVGSATVFTLLVVIYNGHSVIQCYRVQRLNEIT